MIGGLFGWVREKYTDFEQTMKSEKSKNIYRVTLPDGHLVFFNTMWDAVKWKEKVQKLEVEMVSVVVE